jgi:hypothetical protein
MKESGSTVEVAILKVSLANILNWVIMQKNSAEAPNFAGDGELVPANKQLYAHTIEFG